LSPRLGGAYHPEMESKPPEDNSLATTIWSLILWLGLFLITQACTIAIGIILLKNIAGFDAVAAGNIAILCGAIVSYIFLFVVARRDANSFPAVQKEGGLGATAKGLLIFTAVLLPFAVLSLRKLLFGLDLQPGPSPIALAQQFQGFDVFVFWSLFILSQSVFVIIAPIVEERFFRQWLWRRLEDRGLWLTVGLSGAAFLLIHLRGPLGMLSLLPLTLLVSFARAKTGSPKLGMWLHGINNFIAFAGAGMVLRFFQ
jgi:membrane protease YdiL (CAAX protease family)